MKSKMCLTCPDGPLVNGAKSRWDRECQIAHERVRDMSDCPKTATRKPRKRELHRRERERKKAIADEEI